MITLYVIFNITLIVLIIVMAWSINEIRKDVATLWEIVIDLPNVVDLLQKRFKNQKDDN